MAFPEMSLSEVAPEDVPATYFVAVQVSERRQSVGLGRGGGAGLMAPRGRLSEKGTTHKGLFDRAKKL